MTRLLHRLCVLNLAQLSATHVRLTLHVCVNVTAFFTL